jgi:uncharacterized protein YjbI with pentapeptide repeats
MDFSGCEFLEMIPDVSNIPNLEDLNLEGCRNLVEVHRSVGFLDKLVKLNLNFCFNLNSFPKRLRLRSLEYLGLYSCSKLNYFPEIECKMEGLREISLTTDIPSSIQHASSLINLDLIKSINLTNLLSSIYQLEHLDHLTLGNLKLGKFPEKMGDNKQSMPSIVSEKESEISSCLELTPLPPPTNSSVSNDGCSSVVFPALRELNLKNCVISESNIFKIFNCSSTLKWLNLSGSDIVTIPACIKRFVCLEKLNLKNCKKLREISSCLELPPLPPPTNSSVSNDGCSSVVFPALRELDLENCVLSESNIFKIFNCSSTMKWLNLSGSDIVTIPACIKRFVRLEKLYLKNCKLREISSCLELPPLPPPTNSSVSNDGCSSVVFSALRELDLENCVLSESNIFKIFNCSSTLKWLNLSGSDIVTIPACIKRFVRLEELYLNNCKKLREISALPPNNFRVDARGCMSLETFFEESQMSQVFNTWCLPKLVQVETVFSAPSPMGSGIEPEVSPSSVNNITPDRKTHVGVDASTATYQNVQALQTPQPWRVRNFFP